METTIMGYIGIIGYILGLCRDNDSMVLFPILRSASGHPCDTQAQEKDLQILRLDSSIP